MSEPHRYGSALLSAYISAALVPCSKNVDTVPTTSLDSPLQIKLQSTLKDSSVTVLELGSGAVGLAGLVLAWCYQQHQTEKGKRRRVILTDYDHHVLHQLKRNVSRNAHLWQTDDKDDNATICMDVTLLDWGKPPMDWNAYLGLDTDQAVDLIIGSELVYTPENALACRDCVLSLTQQFPAALVCIVQIMDREGWQNIFLSGLQEAGLYVTENAVDVDCDAAASAMMKRGGSLDRFDFGICYISRTEF